MTLLEGQLYVGPFQLHQFDIDGKGPIQMIRIQGLGVRVLCMLSP
jgi:hypothetical protein